VCVVICLLTLIRWALHVAHWSYYQYTCN